MLSFAVVVEGMGVLAWIIVVSGGKRMRESGWRVLLVLVFLGFGVKVGGVGIVVFSLFFSLSLSLDEANV